MGMGGGGGGAFSPSLPPPVDGEEVSSPLNGS